MKDMQYNKYIENYLKHDKTDSAIMLTAEWGSGKSYYIQNDLLDYIRRTSEYKCITISLYGLNSTNDISKSIYFELAFSKINKHGLRRKTKESSVAIAKTIFKTGIDYIGIDIKSEERDLLKICNMLDFSKLFIIFEDVERSKIPSEEILGFVNNLVETAKAKVLIVANESEMIKKSTDADNYIQIKEKTISDTIYYSCDFYEAIKSILSRYYESCKSLSFYKEDSIASSYLIQAILDVMNDVGIHNLRSFIYACQKTSDIFSKVLFKVDRCFFESVFLGIVGFSLRKKNNEKLIWDENTNANKLGTSKYPLFRFSYDYLNWQEFNEQDIQDEQKKFIERIENEQKQIVLMNSLSVLYDFTNKSEKEVDCAIADLLEKLKIENLIDISQYGKLGNYLIAAKPVITNYENVDRCKAQMLENLRNTNNKNSAVLHHINFHDSIEYWLDSQKQESELFFKDMIQAFQENLHKLDKTMEPGEYVIEICTMLLNDNSSLRANGTILGNVNIDILLEGLKVVTAEEIADFRGALAYIYRFSNNIEKYPHDKTMLLKLKEKLQQNLNNEVWSDKIKKLQISFFISNIEDIITTYNP